MTLKNLFPYGFAVVVCPLCKTEFALRHAYLEAIKPGESIHCPQGHVMKATTKEVAG